MFALFATNFAILMKNGSMNNELCVIICLIVATYFACELLSYYLAGTIAKNVYHKIENDSISCECGYNKISLVSKVSFVFLRTKTILLIVAVLIQLLYFFYILKTGSTINI